MPVQSARLDKVGFEVGLRLLELLSYREKTLKRKPEVLDVLRFIHSTAWPYMFGKNADDLQQAAAVSVERRWRRKTACAWRRGSKGGGRPLLHACVHHHRTPSRGAYTRAVKRLHLCIPASIRVHAGQPCSSMPAPTASANFPHSTPHRQHTHLVLPCAMTAPPSPTTTAATAASSSFATPRATQTPLLVVIRDDSSHPRPMTST